MALLIYVIIIYNDIEGVFFMLGIAVFDDEKIIVDYVGKLLLKPIKKEQWRNIYYYCCHKIKLLVKIKK